MKSKQALISVLAVIGIAAGVGSIRKPNTHICEQSTPIADKQLSELVVGRAYTVADYNLAVIRADIETTAGVPVSKPGAVRFERSVLREFNARLNLPIHDYRYLSQVCENYNPSK
jgi:hypothetical protein